MNRAELDDIIYQIFGIKQIPQVVDKQIRKYRCSGIEYKAIARTIVYYAQKIKKLPTEIELRQYGIHSIMAYIDEAEKYWKIKNLIKTKDVKVTQKQTYLDL